MNNTSNQSPTDQTPEPKAEGKEDKALEPAIIGLITEGDTEDLVNVRSTPAEIIVNKDLDPEEKRRQLLRKWGSKGGETTKRRMTKWKPIFIEISRQLAAIGITEADMAALFQVRVATFRGWKRAHQSLRLALKEGEGLKKTTLTMQMQAGAAAGQYVTQIFLAKNWLGMTDKQEQTMKGGQTIIYKSMIPQERGAKGVDPGSIKGQKTKKLQDREP